MIKLVSSTLWPQIETYANNAKRIIAAVAYVTDDLKIRFKRGDLLIVDASDGCISSGSTSQKTIISTIKRKATVYSLQNLHAKLFIFDNVLIIGSSNISKSSQYRLHEIGIITDEPAIIEKAKRIIYQYCNKATKIDKRFLNHIKTIPIRNENRIIGNNAKINKPTLLEIFKTGSELLDDYVIFLYENDVTLTNKEIRKKAKSKNVKLPPTNVWSWYEDSLTQENERIYRYLFKKKELKAIGILVKSKQNIINKVIGVDETIQIYLNQIIIKRKLVTNFIDDHRAPFKFNSRELIHSLNQALIKIPNAGLKLSSKPAWIVKARDFAKILGYI